MARQPRIPYKSVKFHLAQSTGHLISGHGPGYVRVNAEEVRQSFVLFPETGWTPWSGLPSANGDPNELAAQVTAAWKEVVEHAPNVVIIGTGATLKFPHPSLLRPLIDARIGYEVMDTAAACRTYNVLVSEGRSVAAAVVVFLEISKTVS